MSAGIITTGSKPRLLLPGITNLFGLTYAQLMPVHTKIFDKKSSQRNYEEAVQLTGVGLAQLKNEGEAIAIDSIGQSFVRLTRHQVWGKKIRITKEAFDDDLYLDQAKVLSAELAKSLFHTKETNAAAIFNNATSTTGTYALADGKALLASDHVLGGGGSFSNIVTADLSELALEQAIINLRAFKDNAGLRILANPGKLLIPSALIFEAHRILKSDLRVGTADNDINAIKSMGALSEVVEWRFLTDDDSWFIITDGAGGQAGFIYYERTAAEPHYYMDDSTFDHMYCMTERYSFDAIDPRHVIGSMGA